MPRSATTTLPVESELLGQNVRDGGEIDVLVLAWSSEQPERVGEIAVLTTGTPQVIGRGEGEPGEARLVFVRQRPGSFEAGPPLAGAGLSRRQLLVEVGEQGVTVERIGQCELRVNGVACERAVLRPGDTVYLRRQVLLLYVKRVLMIAKARFLSRTAGGAFGEPDEHGIIGESPATWLLREQLAFIAQSGTHALLVGASGTGKELAARAIHAMSGRAPRPFVARNAATLPLALVDAELFGSARNYPNVGMPERPGLIGQADGGTLFLDEIGELPTEQQAHLLRVLDAGGEYQRLGEATTRRSDFRLVAATNRDPSVLKHDLRARLTSLLTLSPLAERREEIPLLARHLLLRAAAKSPQVAGRFVQKDASGRAVARLGPSFVEAMLHRDFETNTRELDAALWSAMSEAHGDEIAAPAGQEVAARPRRTEGAATGGPLAPSPGGEPTDDAIREALSRAGGRMADAARILGLSSRFALYRLMKKRGIEETP